VADYTNSQAGVGGTGEEGVTESEWLDSVPLITPNQLRTRMLNGIPLVSGWADPITRKRHVMDNEEIKDFIVEAASLAQTESGLNIFPKVHSEKLAFDKQAYESYGYMMLRHRPVSSVESLTIQPSNGLKIFTVPKSWIDPGHLHMGQICLIPFTAAIASGGMQVMQTAEGGFAFLALFGHNPWIPSFWHVDYTVGYQNGLLTRAANQLIGTIAAMEILSNLATTYARTTGQSLGLDGMSQSQSGPGPAMFDPRLKFLAEKRRWLVKKLQRQVNLGFIVDNV
jgi:hypothetical protein